MLWSNLSILKNFFILIVITLLTPIQVEANIFGKYKSFYQASEACKKWKEKGIKYWKLTLDYQNGVYKKDYESNNRSCRTEATTKQILGLEEIEVKSGKSYKWEEISSFTKKVKKNFRY